ncbi:hypothetical protein K432DRAFT_383797 [Lepidopterella palustris CBS 459.81]|uniref:ATP synthase protein 8 n=1 Tax=Lepidopterella palustris CBS 459.81 TaxID=1314670 RepID=A0A8E2JDK4_9PEZI|nr:hypothetical protein K432DRAFT_383797 [Lepidopterella palustris CBS 459.81]
MNSTRLFRPLARAVQRQPAILRPSIMARPAFAAAQSKSKQIQGPAQANKGLTMMRSAMPQLIPFFFMNEVTFAFILIPSLIYVFSKYLLPQRVRLMAARLFISKL